MQTRLQKTFMAVVISLTCLVVSLVSISSAATAPTVTVLAPITKHVGSPVRLVFDAQGDFFVADPRIGGVSKFAADGRFVEVLKTKTPPIGVALNDKGNLLVSQGTSVVVLDREGEELGRLGSGVGQFKKANGIAVDAAGFIYVVDSFGNNVKVFNSAGQFVQAIGSAGSAPGQFSMPTGIAYEKSSNQIAVADTMNGRVQFFNASGNFSYVKTIGSFGVDPLQFRSPQGVAFEYDAAGQLSRMYVVDTFKGSVQVLDPAGNGGFLAYIGNSGYAGGQLMAPLDAAFDQVNHRLVVANGYGYLTLYGIDGGTSPAPNAPPALSVDPVAANVRTAAVTLSGTMETGSSVVVSMSTAVAAPVVYTSATTWSSTVTGLAAGNNDLIVKATDSEGKVSKHSVNVIYTP